MKSAARTIAASTLIARSFAQSLGRSSGRGLERAAETAVVVQEARLERELDLLRAALHGDREVLGDARGGLQELQVEEARDLLARDRGDEVAVLEAAAREQSGAVEDDDARGGDVHRRVDDRPAGGDAQHHHARIAAARAGELP